MKILLTIEVAIPDRARATDAVRALRAVLEDRSARSSVEGDCLISITAKEERGSAPPKTEDTEP